MFKYQVGQFYALRVGQFYALSTKNRRVNSAERYWPEQMSVGEALKVLSQLDR